MLWSYFVRVTTIDFRCVLQSRRRCPSATSRPRSGTASTTRGRQGRTTPPPPTSTPSTTTQETPGTSTAPTTARCTITTTTAPWPSTGACCCPAPGCTWAPTRSARPWSGSTPRWTPPTPPTLPCQVGDKIIKAWGFCRMNCQNQLH